MKQQQFRLAIAGVPNYYAVFRLKRVPSQYEDCPLNVGDVMYWNNFRSQIVRVRNSVCMQIEARDLTFVSYMTVVEMREADNA